MLKSKVNINNNAPGEYGMLYDNKDGTFDLYHMNKNVNALSQFVRDRLVITTTPFNPNTYMAANHPDYQTNVGIVLVVNDNQTAGATNKWFAENWMDAVIDAPLSMVGQQTDPPRFASNGLTPHWPMINVDSFVKFMLAAFPNDASRWDMKDPNMAILKRACRITRFD